MNEDKSQLRCSAGNVDAEYEKLAEARIARQGRMLGRLRKAIKPFADIALAQDADTAAPDMIEAADLAISPSDVRAAREAFNNLDADFLNEPQAAPAWEDLTAIIRPMIESVCSDGNSDAARLAKDIAARIIASCSLTRPKEK